MIHKEYEDDDEYFDIDQYIQDSSDDWTISGTLRFKYDIKAPYDDRKNLHGKLIHINSKKFNIYECDYVHGIKEGREIIRYKNGEVKESSLYKNNLLHGKKEYFDIYGVLSKEEHYSNGLLHGVSRVFEYHKLKIETHYKHGKKNGKEIVENWGKYDQYNFKDDLKHGIQVRTSFGRKYTEKFSYGKRNGVQYAFDEDGAILSKEKFVNDIREGKQYIYYKNTLLGSLESYKNGQLQGRSITYFSNGNISTKESFINSRRHGTQLTFYENGNLKTKSNYISDIKFGLHEGYYENGAKAFSIFYKNGDPVGPNKWFSKNGELLDTSNKSFLQVTNNTNYIVNFPSESFGSNWWHRLRYNFEGDGEFHY